MQDSKSMAVRALEQNLVKESGDLVQDLVEDCISRQAAIDAINKIAPVDTEYDCTLLDRIDVRYVLIELPSAQPEIVRCKDCKHWKGNDEPIPWNDGKIFIKVPCETKPMDFCSMGERREDDER